MYATLTHLKFRDDAARTAAIEGLRRLIADARRSPALVDCYVLAVDADAAAEPDTEGIAAVMVTIYTSEQAAAQLSGDTRVHIGEAIGPYVSGAPERYAGTLVIGG